ncbi:MAG TPA: hypothetical protein H9823_08495 [Candidatus Rubneribacter avistercoris]|nr:hypothetical protein [Candidatus Rubneribacter avistercoris]
MKDEGTSKKDKQDEAGKRKTLFKKGAAVVAGLALVAAVGFGAGTAFSPASVSDSPAPVEDDTALDEQAPTGKEVVDKDGEVIGTVVDDGECEHDWTMTYKSVHHDAVTHTETVDPAYDTKTSYHSVCNDCEEVIDGVATQHIKDTGHSGYSTNVPITDEVLVSEGYTREVTDTPAYDETVADKMVCTICGEERPVPSANEDN